MLRRILPVTLASLAALAVLITLGTWQLQRLQWKEELISAVESRVETAPVDLPSRALWQTLDVEEIIYQPVRARGRDVGESFYVFTTISSPQNGPYAGQGYWVLTPLVTQEGGVLFVNRGFIPISMKADFAAQGLPSGEIEVTGLVKPDEPPAFFTPEPDPERNLFYSRDVNAMAAAAGLASRPVAPFYIDALESGEGGLPQARETLLSFPNNHLGYALTWYGLALTLIGVAVAFIWRIVREERASRA